jgi:outer membrane receptor protein involved in Fe transport
VQGTEGLTGRLNLTWGLRVDRYSYLDATRLSPRAGLSYRLGDAWSWRASYGRYHQQPFFLFLSAFPQNRSLVPFSADHYVTGLAWTPGDATRVTLEAYRKEYRDYPVADQFPSLSLANVGDTFNVQDVLFPLVSEGRGRSTGVELFAERKFTARWSGQANVAVSRTRHAGRDGVLRPGTFDYPVVVNAVGLYRLSPKWTVSSRLAWLAGRPYTPFDPGLSGAAGRGIYDLARVNGERASAYFRWDVRLDRRFTVGGRPVTLFAGVQNLTNRRNFASYEWSRRTNELAFREQLGLFPSLGLDWRF